MSLQLYDSYQRKLRPFKPLQGKQVGMYACGPTVYNYAHIGNLRTYIFEDVLRRALEFHGYTVQHVINITDVGHLTSDADSGEDKIEQGAKRTGKTAWEIADLYTNAFQDDLQKLNILSPAIWCRATEHIAEQISDIEKIEQRGFTYSTSDGVYFDTSKLESYGYLARLDIAGLNAGSRVDIGEKKHASDFALWKFSRPEQARQMEWDSPWGRGFPGWHIECSAMAVKYLGTQFDIHCGGKDHIPVHHCNEIAQAEVCYGSTLANFWIHGYFLEVDQEKMSKSQGEFLRLEILSKQGYEPVSYRYLCLTASYRNDLKFTWDNLNSAAIAVNKLRALVESWGESSDAGEVAGAEADADSVADFMREVDNDLNTPRALAVMWGIAKGNLPPATKIATLCCLDQILGLGVEDWCAVERKYPDEVEKLLVQREKARSDNDWGEADRLRDAIYQLGYEVEDSATGSKLQPRRKPFIAQPSE